MSRYNVRWRTVSYGHGLDAAVPEGPGIYSIADVTRSHGLVISVEHLYIGKSVNLRRRWREHVHPLETNPGLNGLGVRSELEFWWRRAPAEQITQFESDLIAQLTPRLNRRVPRSGVGTRPDVTTTSARKPSARLDDT